MHIKITNYMRNTMDIFGIKNQKNDKKHKEKDIWGIKDTWEIKNVKVIRFIKHTRGNWDLRCIMDINRIVKIFKTFETLKLYFKNF